MVTKLIAGIIGNVLMIIFCGVVWWKVRDVPMAIVMLIGFSMMIVEFVQTLREKD
jgi:hypothetical protein